MKEICTEKQALAHAISLWGRTAAVKSDPDSKEPTLRYVVGEIAFGMVFCIRGSGRTWAEAFRRAKTSRAPRFGKGGSDKRGLPGRR